MQISTLFPFRRLILAVCVAGVFALSASRAHAVFILTLSQIGGNVVVNGNGTINTTALSSNGSDTDLPFFKPSSAVLFAGPSSLTGYTAYIGGGLTGPAAFGTGGDTTADSGTGGRAGINESNVSTPILLVPQGYTSGSLIMDSSTFDNATFASLGFAPGTYTYTWGTGANADSLIVTGVVPEPSTWAAAALGAGLLGVVTRRLRRLRGA